MNDKNKELFFNDNEDEVTVISINDEDDNTLEAEVIAVLEIQELNKEYIAVLPTEDTEAYPSDELILLIYSEDENGDAIFQGIDDPSELEAVSEAFSQYFQAEN